MRQYYNILQIFTALHNQDDVDEKTMLAVEKALLEAFKDLELWEQKMLQLTLRFEVSEVIL
jgi:hypothetical protein